jgi:NhaC family Na+:H+ antiporter
MIVLVILTLFIASVIVCLLQNWTLVYALLFGLAMFMGLGLHRGYSFSALCKMAWVQGKKVLIVVRILTLIGVITALWRSCGTIAYFIDYGIRLISPPLFILIAFLLTAVLSYTLGTSFGVISTAGLILVSLAHSGNVSLAVTAGAVLSGAYFGDRCSPASSSASLVAAVTETNLYENLHQMRRTGGLPLGASLVIYGVLSVLNPITSVDETMLSALRGGFVMNALVLIPALLMLVLPLCKVPIRLSMVCSIAAAALLSLFLQHMDVWEMLKACVLGYAPADPALAAAVSGGGIVSMLKSMVMVFITGLYAGIMDGIDALGFLHAAVRRLAEKIGLFPANILISLISGMTLCNQTIVVMMVQQLLAPAYRAQGAAKGEEAIDIENAGIMLSGLIPWNIACSIPLDMMGADVSALPYAVLLYLTPLCYLATRRWFYPKAAAAKEEKV